MNTGSFSLEQIIFVAQRIARCDFRTAISRYTTGDDQPWIITVGETYWQRHLVVRSIGQSDAQTLLGLLAADQCDRSSAHFEPHRIDKVVSLEQLVIGGYVGVKHELLAGYTG